MDNWHLFIAHCSAIVGSSIITLAVRYGFGRNIWAINAPDVPRINLYDYLAQAFGLGGGTLGRMAFFVFIVRLLGVERSHTIILWILLGLQLIVNFIFILTIFIQCPGHSSAIWEHSGKANCWDPRVQSYYGYFQGCEDSLLFKTKVSHWTNARTMEQHSIQQQIFILRFFRHTCSGTWIWSCELKLA